MNPSRKKARPLFPRGPDFALREGTARRLRKAARRFRKTARRLRAGQPPAAYSVRRAATGSLLAALRDGMIPPISVSTMLSTIRITAGTAGRTALMSFVPAR